MNNDQILRKIQFTHIIAQATIHSQGQRDLSLHFMLNVTIDLMIEKLLPTDSLFRISFEHPFDQIFTHI
jgi:hypothetical protein